MMRHVDAVRTTVNIDEHLLAEAKVLAFACFPGLRRRTPFD
jgi:hypothetical protein